MKKTVSLLVAVLMIFTVTILSSCSGSDEPKTTETATPSVTPSTDASTTGGSTTATNKTNAEILNDAIEKTLALTSYEASIAINNSIAKGEEVGDIVAEYEFKVNGSKAEGTRTVTAGEASAVTSVYVDGDDVYVKNGEEGVKGSLKDSAFADYDLTKLVATVVKKVPAEVANAGTAAEQEGQQCIVMTLTSEQLSSVYGDFVAEMSAAAEGKATDLALSDVVLAVVYDEDSGYMTGNMLTFTVSLTVDGEARTNQVMLIVAYNNAGTAVEVTVPADLAEYK